MTDTKISATLIRALIAERDHYKAQAERAKKAGELLKVAASEIGKDPDCGFAQALNDAIGAWEATFAQMEFFDTLAEAKAAARADYERRILIALTEGDSQ